MADKVLREALYQGAAIQISLKSVEHVTIDITLIGI